MPFPSLAKKLSYWCLQNDCDYMLRMIREHMAHSTISDTEKERLISAKYALTELRNHLKHTYENL